MDKVDELLTRGVANIISNKEELKKELESRKLNVYLGIDPTATQIHLGHAVVLRKLQQFAQLGHNVTFLIGDFTALIGDTSDKDTERPILTSEQIQENFKTYKKQAEKIVDFTKVSVRHNSEWLKSLTFEDIIKISQHFAVGDFVGRELIRRRLDTNKRVGLHEVLYPVMQGYDSYFLDTDIQLGGTDQTFNMQAGRTLQKDLRNKNSFVLTIKFLMGTDGRKMSKSWGNAVWLNDTPSDMYAKIMAVNDELIPDYLLLATNLNLEDIEKTSKELKNGTSPLLIKKQLALTIVSELYTKDLAQRAQEDFEKRVQGKEVEYKDLKLKAEQKLARNIIDFLVEKDPENSRSKYKELVQQGGVSLNDQKLNTNDIITPKEGDKLKIGKEYFVLKFT